MNLHNRKCILFSSLVDPFLVGTELIARNDRKRT